MPDPFLSVARRPRRRIRRALVVGGIAVGLVALLAAGFGAIALSERDTFARGATVAGIDVGGLGEAEARRTVVRAAAERIRKPIRLAGPDGELQTSGAELGAKPRVEAALATVGEASVLDKVFARLGLRDGPDVALAYRLAPVRAARLANRVDRRFGDPPRDADVRVTDDAIEVVEAQAGTAVDRGALRRELATLPARVTLPIGPAAPVVATPEARSAASRIERLLAASRHVRVGDAEASLSPRRLRTLVRTERDAGSLRVSLDKQGLAASLRVRLGEVEVEPRDATFTVDGTHARVVPSRPGRVLDLERIESSLTSNLASTTHRAWFEERKPELTTQEAQKLGVEERISEFTTYYTCCPPRVTNIQRGVEIMDGTIVRPGKRFSLNDVLGKRTVERGFVEAPQIYNGRLEDAVGGGVSQIATTTYNAAFFAGVQIVAHQPHEFYISRYPMGREATVSWGGPELIWRNDWPAAILVKAYADSDSITVQLYSSKLGRRVETETGEPTQYTAPRTITVSNASLPPGSTRVVQSAGPSGFLISYTRKVYKGSKLRRNEHYVWRYKPENAIVEIGPPAKPKTEPKAKPKAEPPRKDVKPGAEDAPSPTRSPG